MKAYAFAMVMILLLGFVIASSDDIQGEVEIENEDSEDEDQAEIEIEDDDSGDREKVKVEVENADGSKFKYEREVRSDGSIEEKREIRLANGTKIKEVRKLNTSDIRSGDKINLSNGRIFEIKVMPSTASATALARLNLTVCPAETCTIEIKEVGRGNDTKVVYEVKTEKKKKIFGLFKASMKVQADVDAINGTVIAVKNPWWAVFASDDDSEEITPTNTTNASA